MPTAFVTGATGFIGRHIVEQLTRDRWQVTVFHRPASNTARLATYTPALAVGSLDDVDSIAAAIPERCDAVFHVAGNTSFWSGDRAQQHRDNVEGTRHVVEAALRRHAARLIYTSTESAWGRDAPVPFDETAPMRGVESWIGYEQTKHLAELEVRKGIGAGLPAVLLNPAHVLGRYDERSWGRTFRLVRDGKVPGIPPGAASWASGEQVARAHVAAVERGRIGENYLLGGVDASYLEVFQAIGELVGRPTATRPLPAWLMRGYAQVMELASHFKHRAPLVSPEGCAALCERRLVRSDKAVRELGYVIEPLGVMLRDCHGWLFAEGLLGSHEAAAQE